ncbi:hypothetical protein BD410DRAFT_817721 [Rickenella mellea]|uniref:Nucleoporin Nup82 n=1 Tax=Rickenella mellea TaxID=50990 RepID=A0A4R5XEX6_9AGAM|nr:hypothetical protein BD410DRAFT_817721 [Rickenella mellea]
MSNDDDWASILRGHPIFTPPRGANNEQSLELSLSSLPNFSRADDDSDGFTPPGRQKVMCMKDADLILASGSEIRMTSLSDAKLSGGSQKTYKVLHTPNVEFDIRQIALSPNGKLLAVAGVFQVAVVVLPRSGFSKLVTSRVDCKSVQIGQYYHASSSSPPIAKIEWHPWGEAGSTLLVMTSDGKMREYDISVDPEEPQQTLSFVPERKRGAFVAHDDAEREVVSFALGKGTADWGPLTMYALMKSGDVYAICPYMPQNATIPSAYAHSLECYVAAKQEFISEEGSSNSESFSTLYDYQRKYVNGLMKQLPPGTAFPSTSRSVPMHPPKTLKNDPLRQGPFLFQPSPPELDDSINSFATDVVYVAFENNFDGDEEIVEENSERLNVVLIAFQDGRVDVCLDLEKVEAKWESKHRHQIDLPMFAVYEVIDLGIASLLSPEHNKDANIFDLLHGNHPVFSLDPIHDDTVYIHHAFGVHMLDLRPVLQHLTMSLKEEDEDALVTTLENHHPTSVQPILSTYSVERKSSNPIVAITVPNDVYLTYSIFILTSTMRIVSFALNLRTDHPDALPDGEPHRHRTQLPSLPDDQPVPFASMLSSKPFVIPGILSKPSTLPKVPRLSLPASSFKTELEVTPDTLRYLGSVMEQFTTDIRDVQLAQVAIVARMDMQRKEFERQQNHCRVMLAKIEDVKARRANLQDKLKSFQSTQGPLLARMDRILQTLINDASPELNEHETKWFEELRRMKNQILGAGRYDTSSLVSRVQQLHKEFDRLLPNLTELVKKEADQKAKSQAAGSSFGFSQSFAYGKRSEAERVKLDDTISKIEKLAKKLEITSLGKPPRLGDEQS